MTPQGEFLDSPSETSQISPSSLSLYTPDSDVKLESFFTSLPESDPRANPYDDGVHSFQDGHQLPSDYIWTSESGNLASTFPGVPVLEKDTRESLRETNSINPHTLLFESFNMTLQTPLTIPYNATVANEHNETVDTSKMRTSMHSRRSTMRQASRSSEQRRPPPKLRTAEISRKSTSPNVARPKTSTKRAHNMVEKQYRNRLNNRFSSLLGKIPAELAVSTGLGAGEGKNFSKAETLALAERYIRLLQDEEKELSKKYKRLEEDHDRLKKAWIKSGGVLIP